MPSCRDVARLTDLLHTMADLVSQAVNAPPASGMSQAGGRAALTQQAADAATEVFLEMSQQVGHPI